MGRRSGSPNRPAPFTPATGTDTSWRASAACRSPYIDPEIFFPLSNDWRGRLDKDKVAEAKTVCGGCPVRDACLADCEAAGDIHSIRGGLTPQERRELRQRAVTA